MINDLCASDAASNGTEPLQTRCLTSEELLWRGWIPLDEIGLGHARQPGCLATPRSTRSRRRVGNRVISANCSLGPIPTT